MAWSKPAHQRHAVLKKSFADGLHGIAECLAKHDETSVSERHVNQAFQALSCVGLHRRRWTERPESFTALGGFLFGFAFSCPTGVSLLFDSAYADDISRSLLVALAIIGIFLMLFGWHTGKLPSAPRPERTIWGHIWQIAYWVIIVLLASGAAYTIYLRVVGCTDPACGGDAVEITVDPDENSGTHIPLPSPPPIEQ
jgi:hypothetical protein